VNSVPILLEAISKPPLRPNLCVGSRWPILEIPPWRDYCGCPRLIRSRSKSGIFDLLWTWLS